MASSSQSSSSYSSSTPVMIRTPENDLIDQLSGVAAGLAQQMVGWAQDTFAKTSQITDAAVGNFFNVSQQMMGLSNNLTNQYNNIFAPQNASLAREADSYNSTARQKLNMGAAGATAAQAGDAALKGAEESLRSYGIDPSSGRYAALDKAAAVQNSANIAGEMNKQRDRDIATGQKLRSEAVQVGATLPAAIANVNNTAIQANTGASNASLANANTGANLNRLPNEYLKTAMDIKLPPIGQQSSGGSSSQGQSNSPSGGGGGPGGGQGGGSGGGSGGGGQAWMPTHGDAQAKQSGSGSASRIHGGSAAGIYNLKPYGSDDYSDPTGQNYDPMSSIDPNSFSGSNDYYQPQDGYNMGVGQSGYSDDPFDNYNNPFQDSGFGQTFDYGGPDQTFTGGEGGRNTEWGDINYDPGANSVDPGWDNTYDTPVQTDWGNGASAYQDYGSGGGSTAYVNSGGGGGGGGYDTSSPSSDYYAGDYQTSSGDYYAEGGPVPAQMSPSGGMQTDDVPAMAPGGPAQLNANEFVIPQDVALWKGQEFFQKLINQSRMANSTAGAKPQQKPMR